MNFQSFLLSKETVENLIFDLFNCRKISELYLQSMLSKSILFILYFNTNLINILIKFDFLW